MFYIMLEEVVTEDNVDYYLEIMAVGEIYVCQGGIISMYAISEKMEELDQIFTHLDNSLESDDPLPDPQDLSSIVVSWINGPVDQDGTFSTQVTEDGLCYASREHEEIIVLYIGRDSEAAQQLLTPDHVHAAYAATQIDNTKDEPNTVTMSWITPGEA